MFYRLFKDSFFVNAAHRITARAKIFFGEQLRESAILGSPSHKVTRSQVTRSQGHKVTSHQVTSSCVNESCDL